MQDAKMWLEDRGVIAAKLITAAIQLHDAGVCDEAAYLLDAAAHLLRVPGLEVQEFGNVQVTLTPSKYSGRDENLR